MLNSAKKRKKIVPYDAFSQIQGLLSVLSQHWYCPLQL